MVFSSLTFLYFFLPAVFLLYFLLKNRVYRNTVLLVASLLFYAWGEPKFLFVMLAAVLVAYAGGLILHRMEEKSRPRAKKAACIAVCLILTANLFVFKYLNFTVSSLETLLGWELPLKEVTLPIGISFYTFQILSYVIDLYRGKVKVQKNFFYLTLYVSLFPQLIAGPIVRYETVEGEIRARRESLSDIACGLRRFILGLAKKVILSNNLASIAELIYAGDKSVYGTTLYWLAALSFALQIYFDFSGYSDMAIGLGRMFGFHFHENFDRPYLSLSVTEFWRRWHISLGSWFRDYIYIPLGGNRVKTPRFILNILIVWGLTGLWHGASWNFLLWGLYYGLLLLVEKLLLKKLLLKKHFPRLPKVVRFLYTAFFVLLGWVLFNLTDFGALGSALSMMFRFRGSDFLTVVTEDSKILYAFLYLPLGILCVLPFGAWLKRAKTALRGKYPRAAAVLSPFAEAVGYAALLLLLVLCILFILSATYNPFIYFRF